MHKHSLSRPLAAALLVLALAVGLASSAAAAPRASAASVYSQLSGDFHAINTVSSRQIKTAQHAFEKGASPCLTKAFTAVIAAQAPGAANASAAKIAFKALAYEAALQMVMKSSRPLLKPYLRVLKLIGGVSVLTPPERRQVVRFETDFAKAQRLRTCTDATKWAAASYSLGSEPKGVKLITKLEQVTSGTFPDNSKFKGITPAQSVALERDVKLAAKSFKRVIKQVDASGSRWLEGVVITAEHDAQQQ
jgi:hypothetical protein